MNTKLLVLLILLLFVPHYFLAQKQGNIWYFGQQAGLNFNTTPPTALTDGVISTSEGCASIADCAGNLLFYTDGITVWDKTHTPMPNGTGLFGHPSSTQSAVIIPQPGNDSIYYIFTASISGNNIYYSVINIHLNGGLGEVTMQKNILVLSPGTERVAAIRHANNIDVWIIAPKGGSSDMHAYLLTSSGFTATPVVSSVGAVSLQGYLKASQDGTKVCEAQMYQAAQLFDFDRATGIFSNPVNLTTPIQEAYGVEFSPDGTRLYISTHCGKKIYQYDLTASDINASAIQVSQSTTACLSALQLGPDGKIYVARYPMGDIGIINNPNALGGACNYVDIGISLNGKVSQAGLPNFIPDFFSHPVIETNDVCLGITSYFSLSDTTKTDSVLWNFGDPASGVLNTNVGDSASHLYNNTGTYNITAIIYRTCSTDTLTTTTTVRGVTLSLGNDTTLCFGDSIVLMAGMANSYLWSTGSADASITAASGMYWVQVADTNGCSSSDTIFVSQSLALNTNMIATDVSCYGGTNGSAEAVVSGGTAPYSYSWSTSSTAAITDSLAVGSYTVTVTDSMGCVRMDSIQVTGPVLLNAAISAFTNVGCYGGNSGTATVMASGGTNPYHYSWSSGDTSNVATALPVGNYTVTVTDSNACTALDSVTIISPAQLSVSFSINNITCNGGNDGSLAAVVSGGTNPYSYSWTSGSTTDTAVALSAGDYILTVTDSNNCVVLDTATVQEPLAISIVITPTPTDCDTATGTATAVPANGTSPYAYVWTTTTPQTNATATGLDVGTYTVTVTDTSGCTQVEQVNIISKTGTTVSVAANPTTINQSEQTQLLAAGAGTYLWTPATNLSCTDCQSSTASPNQTTTYCVTLTDNNGCTDSACVTITVENPCGYFDVPTAFSPNNDGHNDYFLLQGVASCIDEFQIRIFDRWGEKVFETQNIAKTWDGTYNGKPLNSGVFVYHIGATLLTGESVVKKGNITLIR